MAKTITLIVNGKPCFGEVESRTLLPHFLRDTLRLTGTHWAASWPMRCLHGSLERHRGEILYGVRRSSCGGRDRYR
jgi:hypothetical protein